MRLLLALLVTVAMAQTPTAPGPVLVPGPGLTQAPVIPDNHLALCHKQFLQFWRIHMDSAKGDWHLLNEEDKRWLKTVREKIAAGEYKDTVVEYAAVEGSLPE